MSTTVATARRVLPPELRRIIARHLCQTFARHATPALADTALAQYRLASRKMTNGLRFVLVVQRCTPTPRSVALGVYERHRPYPVPYLTVEPLDKTRKWQGEWWIVHSKKPARYLAAVFRARAIYGPWKEHDRGAKVALEPVRSSTAVIGGDTVCQARNRLYAMTRGLVRTSVPV